MAKKKSNENNSDPLAGMSGESKLEKLLKDVEVGHGTGEAAEKIQETANAQNSINSILGYNVDYTNPEIAAGSAKAAYDVRDSMIKGYMGEYGREIINAIPDEKLLSNKTYLAIQPNKNGDEEHDKIVKIHEEYAGLSKVVADYKSGNVDKDKVIGIVKGKIDSDVNKDYSVEKDPQNKYIPKETLEMIKTLRLRQTVISRNGELGSVLEEMANEVSDKLEKSFKDDKAKASYARDNIIAYKGKEDKERETAGLIYQIMKAK